MSAFVPSKLYNILVNFKPKEKEKIISWNSLCNNIDSLEKYHREIIIFISLDHACFNNLSLDTIPFNIINCKNGKQTKEIIDGDSAIIPDTVPDDLKYIIRKYVHIITTVKNST